MYLIPFNFVPTTYTDVPTVLQFLPFLLQYHTHFNIITNLHSFWGSFIFLISLYTCNNQNLKTHQSYSTNHFHICKRSVIHRVPRFHTFGPRYTGTDFFIWWWPHHIQNKRPTKRRVRMLPISDILGKSSDRIPECYLVAMEWKVTFASAEESLQKSTTVGISDPRGRRGCRVRKFLVMGIYV